MDLRSARLFHWDQRYSRRRPKEVYNSEEQLLFPNPVNLQAVIDGFLRRRRSGLDPPEEIRFPALRKFLTAADPRILQPTPPPGIGDLVLLDDRRDPTGGHTSTRLWDSEGENGYFNYPPVGNPVFSKPLGTPDLIIRLREKRQDNNAEKRNIYFANISPGGMLALAFTVNSRAAPLVRGFLNQHLRFKVFFGVTMGLSFEMQFHIPYFTLRRRSLSQGNEDKRSLHGKALRSSRQLPLARNKTEESDYYHEAHTSFLITGVDEWFWTSYCCVDTYFGSEPESQTYLDGRYGSDPATGGSVWLKFPVWNPREYFLAVLARRMMQATREWGSLVDEFQERMEVHEEQSLSSFLDDPDLTRTKDLTLAVSTLRRFRDTLSSTVAAWEIFERREIGAFDVTGSDAFRQRWESYLVDVRGSVAELRSIETTLGQKLELFNSMRDGLVNASALRESASATRQGEYIGILTRMTVFYLPLSLATGLFSISMVPPNKINWVYYALVSLILTSVTLYAAAHPRLFISQEESDAFGSTKGKPARNTSATHSSA